MSAWPPLTTEPLGLEAGRRAGPGSAPPAAGRGHTALRAGGPAPAPPEWAPLQSSPWRPLIPGGAPKPGPTPAINQSRSHIQPSAVEAAGARGSHTPTGPTAGAAPTGGREGMLRGTHAAPPGLREPADRKQRRGWRPRRPRTLACSPPPPIPPTPITLQGDGHYRQDEATGPRCRGVA